MLLAAGVTAVVSYALSLLVTRGVITGTEASTITQQVTALVAALIPVLLGVVARAFVTPTAKAQAQLATAVANTSVAAVKPGLTDADLATLQAMLDEKLGKTLDAHEIPAILDPPPATATP